MSNLNVYDIILEIQSYSNDQSNDFCYLKYIQR